MFIAGQILVQIIWIINSMYRNNIFYLFIFFRLLVQSAETVEYTD